MNNNSNQIDLVKAAAYYMEKYKKELKNYYMFSIPMIDDRELVLPGYQTDVIAKALGIINRHHSNRTDGQEMINTHEVLTMLFGCPDDEADRIIKRAEVHPLILESFRTNNLRTYDHDAFEYSLNEKILSYGGECDPEKFDREMTEFVNEAVKKYYLNNESRYDFRKMSLEYDPETVLYYDEEDISEGFYDY